MINLEENPICLPSMRRILAHIAWKVAIHGCPPPSNFCPPVGDFAPLNIRSFISLAALLVKVIMRIDSGAICFSVMRYSTLYVRTLVFPDPAPAKMITGPSVVSTASFCSGFKSLSSVLFIEYNSATRGKVLLIVSQ